MRMRSKVLALFFIIAIPLVLSSCSTMGPGAKLPPNKVLYAKITEVGCAMGVPLVYEFDADTGNATKQGYIE